LTQTTFESVTTRIAGLDWVELARQLDEQGFAVTGPVLSAEECVELADLFDGDRFRSRGTAARCLDRHRRHPYRARHHLPRRPVTLEPHEKRLRIV
jgi:hypothetical protein